MNTEQERADFEAWVIERYRNPLRLTYDERRIAWEAYQAGRAALQSQDREDTLRYRRPSWAGVTVWVGDRQKTHAITKQEFEYCKIDVLQAAFDHARRIEGDEE